MSKSKNKNWRTDFDWTDPNDHPVEDEFQPKVLKAQVVKFYKKPKIISLKPGGRKIKSFGVIELDKPLFPISKEVK